MRFLSNFGCKIIVMRSVNFWQDYNSLFTGSIWSRDLLVQVAYSIEDPGEGSHIKSAGVLEGQKGSSFYNNCLISADWFIFIINKSTDG